MAAQIIQQKRSTSPPNGYLSKRMRIVLESETSHSSSDEAESIYSLQNIETATPHDTSDTSEGEFDVVSLSEVSVSDTSSGPEECAIVGNLSSIVEEFGSEISYIADMSDTFSSEEDNIRRTVPWLCVKCKGASEYPFRLCLKCFRQKKIYLPPRPKGGRRKRNPESSPSRGASFCSLPSSQECESSASQVQGSSQESKATLCKCCFASPIDGVFIHKNTVHPMYCYRCSVKQWRLRGRCPFCNQKLCKVAKIFPVED